MIPTMLIPLLPNLERPHPFISQTWIASKDHAALIFWNKTYFHPASMSQIRPTSIFPHDSHKVSWWCLHSPAFIKNPRPLSFSLSDSSLISNLLIINGLNKIISLIAWCILPFTVFSPLAELIWEVNEITCVKVVLHSTSKVIFPQWDLNDL